MYKPYCAFHFLVNSLYSYGRNLRRSSEKTEMSSEVKLYEAKIAEYTLTVNH